ncbi:MAG: pilus assembly protein PilM [Candidatus Gracilibacteria bacterium]|jgi:type IV pilus assembly protein PilM
MKFFPKTVVGIDLHDHLVQLIVLRKHNGDISLEGYNRMTIPTGIIKDGSIEKDEDFKQILIDLFRKANPKPVIASDVAILLPTRTTFIHIFSFPANLSKKDIINAIPYEAEMVIPFAMQDLYWDFLILENEKTSYQYVLFAAVPKKVGDKYTQILGSIGITPSLYGINAETLKYALRKQLPINKSSLIIDIGALSTNYLILKGDIIKYFISSNEGTSQLIQEISKKFNVENDHLFENWEQCKTDKRYAETINEFIKAKYRMAVAIIMEKQDKNEEIQDIFLTGEFSNLPEFYDLAKVKFVGRQVHIGDPKVGLKIEDEKFLSQVKKKDLKIPYSIYFTNAIGVALKKLEMKTDEGINLIPRWLKKSFASRRTAILIVTASVLMSMLSLFIAGFIVYKHQQLNYQRTILEGKKSNIELTLYGTRYQEVKTELDTFNNEVMILRNIDNGLFSVPTVLEDIYSFIPEDGISITSVKFNDTDLYIEIAGIASTREKLLELQRNAEASILISQAEIPLASYDKKTKIPFQLNLYLDFTQLPQYDTSSAK